MYNKILNFVPVTNGLSTSDPAIDLIVKLNADKDYT